MDRINKIIRPGSRTGGFFIDWLKMDESDNAIDALGNISNTTGVWLAERMKSTCEELLQLKNELEIEEKLVRCTNCGYMNQSEWMDSCIEVSGRFYCESYEGCNAVYIESQETWMIPANKKEKK